VQRTSCTSLYGSWRPGVGGEASLEGGTSLSTYRSAARKAAQAAAALKPDLEPKKKSGRGRPPVEKKPAVQPHLLPEFVARAAHVLKMNGGKMDSNLFGQHWKVVHVNAPIYSFKSIKGVTIHQMLRENGDFFSVSETNRQKVKMFQINTEAVEVYLTDCREQGLLSISPVSPEQMLSNVQGVEIEARPITAMSSDEERGVMMSRNMGEEEAISTEGRQAQTAAPVVHEDVPVHGKASRGISDRRVLKERQALRPVRVREVREEVQAVAPLATDEDALEGAVVALYNSWAMDGRDVVMEISHQSNFEELWTEFLKDRAEAGLTQPLTVVDGGCGNGWAARRMADSEEVESVTGIDAAALMVNKAATQSEGIDKVDFAVGDVNTWVPEEQVDVAHFTEVLYLLEDPAAAMAHVVDQWLKPGGTFIAGVDCYKENKISHAWAEDLGVAMHCLPEARWKKMAEAAGLDEVVIKKSTTSGPWQGSLLITGTKKA
jgi:predicted TPR repeat methyltransferase